MTFDINVRSRILLALDVVPDFAGAADGWEKSDLDLDLVVPGAFPAGISIGLPTESLKVVSRLFEKGRVTIPGPRHGKNIGNRFAYLILVRPV